MSFSNEIITLINELAARFGIVIERYTCSLIIDAPYHLGSIYFDFF